MKKKHRQRQLRHIRVRRKVVGSSEKPRLVVFRSNKHFYAQLIDDTAGTTLVFSSDMEIKPNIAKDEKNKKVSISHELGLMLAKRATALKIKKVVFDRNGYQFHGSVKSFAEGARKGGLSF